MKWIVESPTHLRQLPEMKFPNMGDSTALEYLVALNEWQIKLASMPTIPRGDKNTWSIGDVLDDKGHDMGANGIVAWIKVDHVVPVKLGGGACWLSNYQLLCHDCHVGKTNTDFGWKAKIEMPELFNSLDTAHGSDATEVKSGNKKPETKIDSTTIKPLK